MRHLTLALVAIISLLAGNALAQGGAFSKGSIPPPVDVPYVAWDMEYPELPTALAFEVDPTAPSMSTSWTTAEGFVQTVNTPRRKGEGKNNQAKRHHVSVQALANEMGGPAPQPAGI